MSRRIKGLSWLLVLALFLGAADEGLAGKKNKKKKGKKQGKAESSERSDAGGKSESPAPAPAPRVVSDVDRRLLAYDTDAARDLLAGEAIDSNVHLQIADGRVLAQEGNHSKAVDRLSRAANDASAGPAPLVYLGDAHARARNYGAAKDAYAKAEARAKAILDSSPKDAETLYYLGVALRGQERYDEAIQTLEKAGAASSRDARIPFQIGVAQASKRNWQEAVDSLTRAIDMNSGIAYAYYYRGLAADEIGRKDLMVNDFDRFLFMAPNAPEAEQVKRLLGGL